MSLDLHRLIGGDEISILVENYLRHKDSFQKIYDISSFFNEQKKQSNDVLISFKKLSEDLNIFTFLVDNNNPPSSVKEFLRKSLRRANSSRPVSYVNQCFDYDQLPNFYIFSSDRVEVSIKVNNKFINLEKSIYERSQYKVARKDYWYEYFWRDLMVPGTDSFDTVEIGFKVYSGIDRHLYNQNPYGYEKKNDAEIWDKVIEKIERHPNMVSCFFPKHDLSSKSLKEVAMLIPHIDKELSFLKTYEAKRFLLQCILEGRYVFVEDAVNMDKKIYQEINLIS